MIDDTFFEKLQFDVTVNTMSPDIVRNMAVKEIKLWRSALSVPAVNRRALEKSKTLAADAVIYDLEDPVAHGRKAEARENLEQLLRIIVPPA
nr:aldolase/citrate lyase family protein [Marinicella sp. W31]MDC2875860.1 aldolase/citrate lyase family protein [Marinicella sp. W31]